MKSEEIVLPVKGLRLIVFWTNNLRDAGTLILSSAKPAYSLWDRNHLCALNLVHPFLHLLKYGLKLRDIWYRAHSMNLRVLPYYPIVNRIVLLLLRIWYNPPMREWSWSLFPDNTQLLLRCHAGLFQSRFGYPWQRNDAAQAILHLSR
jgi:hypothetical protein